MTFAERTVEVSRDRSDDVGGCSFCNRYITEHGEARHRVYNVGGNGVSVRFCELCAMSFAAKVTL